MRILIAEDEKDVALTYKYILENRGHVTSITHDGEECLQVYEKELANILRECHDDNQSYIKNPELPLPFDVVLLDYQMPNKNGLEVAKEILKSRPDQRIVFASAYVMETLEESVKELAQVTELLQKPFSTQDLVDTIEDGEVYEGLKMLTRNVLQIDKESNLNVECKLEPTDDQIKQLFEGLRKIQKARTFTHQS